MNSKDGNYPNLNVAIVGCGRIGEREALAVTSIPNLTLVGVSDVGQGFREKALRIGQKYGCDAVNNWQHLVTRNDVDIVVVSTPNNFHKEMCIEAIKNGKHVICEKPLAGSPQEAEEILLAAEVSGVKVMTNFNHRRHEHNQRAKELLKEGIVGQPIFVRGRIGHAQFIVGRSSLSPERLECQDTWYVDANFTGGGTLIDNGVHLLDLLRWLIGEEFVEAQGTLTHNLDICEKQSDGRSVFKRPSKCEDNAFAVLKTKSGCTASIHSSWVQWQGYLYLEIFGTNGSLVVNNDQIQGQVSYNVFSRHGDPPKNITEVPACLRPDPSWKLQLQEFAAAIREGREPTPNGYDGLQALRLVDAVYSSSRLGKTVTVKTDLPTTQTEPRHVAVVM
jgi:predicted dehydrogenase